MYEDIGDQFESIKTLVPCIIIIFCILYSDKDFLCSYRSHLFIYSDLNPCHLKKDKPWVTRLDVYAVLILNHLARSSYFI